MKITSQDSRLAVPHTRGALQKPARLTSLSILSYGRKIISTAELRSERQEGGTQTGENRR